MYFDVVICGILVYDVSVFKVCLYGCYVIYVWVWINMLLLYLCDIMCGFCVYLLLLVLCLIGEEIIGWCMDFDIEVMVCLYWCWLLVEYLVMCVIYFVDGVLYFDVWCDNVCISCMYICLFFGMFWCVSWLLWCCL